MRNALVCAGKHLFGARERMRLLGQSPSPKEADLLDTYTTEVRSKNSQVAKFTYGVNF
jgi:hypothetical protein